MTPIQYPPLRKSMAEARRLPRPSTPAPPRAVARAFHPDRPRFWALQENKGPTQRPLNVRIARPDEADKIFDTLMLLGEENAMATVVDERVRDMIERCKGPAPGQRRDGVIGLIDGPNGEIAATVGMIMGQWWYTKEWHVEEVWSFVPPDFRRAKDNHAKALLQFAKWWAEQLKMPLIAGVLSSHRTLGKVMLYSRSLPLAGAIFLWDPNRV